MLNNKIILTIIACILLLTWIIPMNTLLNINKSIDKLRKEIKAAKVKTVVKEIPIIKFKNRKITINDLDVLIKQLQPKLDEVTRYKIAKAVLTECEKKELDPILIIALIYYESSFRPLAKSKSGAIGLMQIRYKIWKEHPILKGNKVTTEDELFWIDTNIKCGTKILKKYINDSHGNIAVALNRYHTGTLKLSKKEYEIPYVNRIMLLYYNLVHQLEVYRNETMGS